MLRTIECEVMHVYTAGEAQQPVGAQQAEEPALQPSSLPAFIKERVRDCSTNKPAVSPSPFTPSAGQSQECSDVCTLCSIVPALPECFWMDSTPPVIGVLLFGLDITASFT